MAESSTTYAARIKQLNDIDQNVARLLKSAGSAIKALTQAPLGEPKAEAFKTSLVDEQKKQFTSATKQYFALVSSVDVALRQQIHALEEADLIPSEVASKESRLGGDSSAALNTVAPAVAGIPSTMNRTALTGGVLGNLDVGWLNSRNDSVEIEMEAELWKKASFFLAELEDKKRVGTNKDEQNTMGDS